MNNTIITCIALVVGLGFTSAALAKQYYGEYLCGYPGFKCIKVQRGDTWEKLFPNARDRDLVMRLNRTNMPVKYRSWIVVPTNLSRLDSLELSPFPLQRDTNGKKLVYVNIGKQAFGAYDEDGKLVHWGPVSGGKGYCPDVGRACNTVVGNFKVYRKQGPNCISSKFPVETNGGAPMPYCMHFHKGYAMHGGELPGYPASHGCVRMMVEDAQWLSQHFVTIGTKVVVKP